MYNTTRLFSLRMIYKLAQKHPEVLDNPGTFRDVLDLVHELDESIQNGDELPDDWKEVRYGTFKE